MKLRVAAQSDTGLVRPANEDDYMILDLSDPGGARLVGVADGMGGHKAGEVASGLALSTLASFLARGDREGGWPSALSRGVAAANLTVYTAAAARDDRTGMGTTLTAGVLARGMLFLVHVGDTRAYLYRNGSIELLTRDDSLVGEMVRRGDLSPAEARMHPHKHVLTRAVGTQPEVGVQLVERRMQPGDRLLLCSDGLYSVVGDDELSAMLGSGDLDRLVESLVRAANRGGGPDNITVVTVEVESL